MNLLDRTVAYFNPEAGERRVAARLRLGMYNSYSGAKRNRRYGEWSPKSVSANEALRWEAETLRQRARDLVRNTPHAANAVRVLAAKQVGTGIIPIISGANQQKWESAWKWFVDSADYDDDTDFYGLQALAARTVVESGEALILLRPRPSSANLRVPLQLQVLEPDFIDDTKYLEAQPGKNFIIQGIEFNPSGKRVAYWLYDRHPGEGSQRRKSRRVRADLVIHLFRKDRPGQVRAAPWLAPVMLTTKDLADYDEAELFAKKIQACTVEVIKSPEGDLRLGEQESDTTAGKVEKMEPGNRIYLRPGEELEQKSPPVVPGFGEYKRSKLHDLAAGFGLTYEMLTGDLSHVNYTSYKAGEIIFREHNDQLRWSLYVPKLCTRSWNAFAPYAEAGDLVSGEPEKLAWQPPRYYSPDPLKDYKATVLAIRAGLMSLRQGIGEMGYDARSVLDDIGEMNEQIDERELILDSDPRLVNASGMKHGQLAEDMQDNQKKEHDDE